MEIFLDSCNLNEILEINDYGIIDGVTTNPSSISKFQKNLITHIKDITAIMKGPVSVQIIDNNYDRILDQGKKILEIASNIVLKIPLTLDGIKACKYFSSLDKNINMTLCFSANQALVAAKAGAEYVSPFIGRIDDIGYDGEQLIKDIKIIFKNYNFKTKILVASIRNINHIYKAALIGADIVTVPYNILRNLISHPLTDCGLEKFNSDWLKEKI